MKAGLLVILLSLFVGSAHAILPLPYPAEPDEESTEAWQQEVKDPKEVKGYYELYSASQLREKELPTYNNGPDILGYKVGETFVVTPELEGRVNFWKKIFSEYTTSQALLHDSDNLDLIYDVVDISKYVGEDSVPYRKKMRALRHFLKSQKEVLQKKLMTLHNLRNDPANIPVELFPLFKKFENIQDENKFKLASHRIRAQVGQRDRLVQGFLYGGRYFNRMMEIFEKRKLPKELTRLPLVESGFNLSARSKVGASGVWQFMRSTGKKFLRIDRAVDERNDPLSATWAAAELMRQNFETLNTWPLAITAYNHGREGMARAVRQLATTELPEIIKRYKARSFGFASSNFYCEFLAVLEVEREYRKYFGKLMVDAPLQVEELLVPDDIRFQQLAGACGMSEQELAVANPALTDKVISGHIRVPRGYSLKVPPDHLDKCKTGWRKISQLARSGVKRG